MGNCCKKNKPAKRGPVEDRSPQDASYTKETIPKWFKMALWRQHHGDAKSGPCYCCGGTIQRDPTANKEQSYHCGHVTAERHGGQLCLSNCRPICRHCNSSMGTVHMAEWYKTMRNYDPVRYDNLRQSSVTDMNADLRRMTALRALDSFDSLARDFATLETLYPGGINKPHHLREALGKIPPVHLHAIYLGVTGSVSRPTRGRMVEHLVSTVQSEKKVPDVRIVI